MIRTGFRPKPKPRENARDRSAEFASFTPARPVARMATAADFAQGAPAAANEATFRSEPYRRLVATLPCIACGIEKMSQAAHPNTGKGGALKTDDRECFPLCHEFAPQRCHQRFDQGAMFTKAARREIEPLWAHQTRTRLRAIARDDASVRRIVSEVIGL